MPAPKKKTIPKTKKKAPAKRKSKKGVSKYGVLFIIFFILLVLSPLYYGYVLKSLTSAWSWVRDIGGNPNYRVYKNFAISIPTNYSIHGIDVSSYQGTIDWQRVKRMHEDSVHVSFAFIKATEGIVLVDPFFQRNWREANKAGLYCGAYHYLRPRFSGKFQARFFLQNAKITKGNLPMVVDVETLDGVSPAKMRNQLIDFLNYTEAKTKVRPIIYSGLKYYQDNLQGYFDDYTLWIAHYYHPELDENMTVNWKFWQHSDRARVNGINSVVDFDVFNGDSLAFKKMLLR